jgi:hypothetical protein
MIEMVSITGSSSTVSALRVPGCNTLPCVIVRGTNVSLEIDFTASKAIILLFI